jgi:hypothetical protein
MSQGQTPESWTADCEIPILDLRNDGGRSSLGYRPALPSRAKRTRIRPPQRTGSHPRNGSARRKIVSSDPHRLKCPNSQEHRSCISLRGTPDQTPVRGKEWQASRTRTRVLSWRYINIVRLHSHGVVHADSFHCGIRRSHLRCCRASLDCKNRAHSRHTTLRRLPFGICQN